MIGISRRGMISAAAGLVALGLTACGTPAGTAPAASASPTSTEPVTLTMWTRSTTAAQSQLMVDEFNKAQGGKITIQLTVVPFADYLAKVGAAAAAKTLPDILAANVIDGPNYTQSGLWTDITAKVNALSYASKLAPAHIKAGTNGGKIYAVPHVTDVSALYANAVLLKKAGLDPAKGPATLDELAANAKKITDLGGGVSGFYFGGKCGGCMAFDLFPSVWADGGTVINDAGNEATLDSAQAKAMFDVYNKMFKDGSMKAESKNEAGATQNSVFETGTIGYTILGSKALGTIKSSAALEMAVTPLPGAKGGVSTFVGGDIIGISANSKKVDAAWTFLKWHLEEQQQLSLYAAKGFLTSRTDLADNQYVKADPRLALLGSLIAKGQTPMSPRFFQTFNDANGPWVAMVQEAIFGAGTGNLTALNKTLTASLQKS